MYFYLFLFWSTIIFFSLAFKKIDCKLQSIENYQNTHFWTKAIVLLHFRLNLGVVVVVVIIIERGWIFGLITIFWQMNLPIYQPIWQSQLNRFSKFSSFLKRLFTGKNKNFHSNKYNTCYALHMFCGVYDSLSFISFHPPPLPTTQKKRSRAFSIDGYISF